MSAPVSLALAVLAAAAPIRVVPVSTGAAAPAVAPAPADTSFPFPAPKLIAVTTATKCDWGVVVSVDVAAQTVTVVMPVGNVTYHAGPEAPVVGSDGKVQSDGIRVLGPGLKVRVYYTVTNEGARAAELDLE